MYYYATPPSTDEIYHHGVKGMRWGVRRYENPDGTLTEKGKKRYGTKENYEKKRAKRKKIAKGAGITAAILATTAASLYGKGKYNEAKYKKRSADIDAYHKRLDRWRAKTADAYLNVMHENIKRRESGQIDTKEFLRRANKRDTQYKRIMNKIFDAKELSPDQIVKIMKKAKRKKK